MPSTPRKPAGAAKGYIVATSWLHAETAFQKKLLLIKSWESTVPIITQYPAPPNFGAIVYGIDDDTRIGHAVELQCTECNNTRWVARAKAHKLRTRGFVCRMLRGTDCSTPPDC